MKNFAITIICFLILLPVVFSQKYITKNGMIKFYSDAPLEKIEAVNNQVISAFDISNGNFVFRVLMKGFEFRKALMQQHFNTDYVESDKFPEASFKGTVKDFNTFNFNKDALNNVIVEGDLTIHGITNHVSEKGTLEKKGDKIIGKSVFTIAIKDYKIKIPNIVVNNISENVQITVEITMTKLAK